MSTVRPTISVIIPVLDEAASIGRCLAAIRSQTYPRDRVEILVVDGGSADDTVRRVEEGAAEDPRIRLLHNPRRDTSSGLNVGIAAANGELIAYVLGHASLPSDYLERMASHLAEHGAWSVGGRIARVGSTPVQRAIAVAASSPFGVGDSRYNYAAQPGWAETAFPGFWRREVFDRVGLFDPEMIVNEDNELSYRIRRAGGRIWYDPGIAIEYVPRATLWGLFRQYHDYARGKIRVLRKHGGGLSWRHALPAAWMAFLVVGGVTALLVPPARLPWLLGIGTYAIVIVLASLLQRRRDVPWVLVAAAFVTLHSAYGSGLWRGVLEWVFGRRG